jgi:hypothetical protein
MAHGGDLADSLLGTTQPPRQKPHRAVRWLKAALSLLTACTFVGTLATCVILSSDMELDWSIVWKRGAVECILVVVAVSAAVQFTGVYAILCVLRVMDVLFDMVHDLDARVGRLPVASHKGSIINKIAAAPDSQLELPSCGVPSFEV